MFLIRQFSTCETTMTKQRDNVNLLLAQPISFSRKQTCVEVNVAVLSLVSALYSIVSPFKSICMFKSLVLYKLYFHKPMENWQNKTKKPAISQTKQKYSPLRFLAIYKTTGFRNDLFCWCIYLCFFLHIHGEQ